MPTLIKHGVLQIQFRRQTVLRRWLSMLALTVALLVAGCAERAPGLPQPSDLPNLPVPQELPDLLNELQLPDLSNIANLPQLDDLPLQQAPAGGIVFNGPTEQGLEPGERIPGTDIELVRIAADGESAEFRINGLRSVRRVGDSLDYDGRWDGIDDVDYSLRLRLYRIGSASLRAAGVHQLVIEEIQPTRTERSVRERTVRLPFTAGAPVGDTFPGLTYGYGGSEERGALITGLPDDEYPFRKVGDSLRWRGLLRADIAAEYNLRILAYTESRGQVGGTVILTLPE